MNLDCNFKPPKRSQHQRLVSAVAPNKQLVDSRSLSLTLFTCFLRIVKAILSRFKLAHLAFPPAAENRGPRPTALYLNSRYNVKYLKKKNTKIMITVCLSRDKKPKYPVCCPRSPGVFSSEGH